MLKKIRETKTIKIILPYETTRWLWCILVDSRKMPLLYHTQIRRLILSSLNPLNPKRDQYLISSYSNTAKSFKRIKEIIANRRSFAC